MDVQNLLSKLGNDKVGQILGFIAAEAAEGNARGWGLFTNIQKEVEAALVQPHFPNIEHVFQSFMDGVRAPIVKPAIMGAVIGYVLDEIDIHPSVNKIGKLLKNVAPNILIGVAYQRLLECSTLSYSEVRLPSSSGFFGGESSGKLASDSEWRFSN